MEDFNKMDMEQKIAFMTSRYAVSGNLSKEEAFGSLIERLEKGEKIPRPVMRNQRRILYLSTAATIVLILTVFLSFHDFSRVKIAAGPGEQKALQLPDGSSVYLNAVSNIRYSNNKFQKNRSLRLNGEAYFEVKKGSLFCVESNYGTIEVLGTSFNVHARENYFKVSCNSGTVLVTAGNRTDILGRGERISLINNNYLVTREADIERIPDWRTGEYYYKSTELRFVLDEIERQFNVSIEASGIENRRFTGSFYRGSLDEALQIVCIPMDLEFEFLGQGKIRISP